MTSSPSLPLTLGATAFTVLWAAWMLWSSGSFDRASVAVLAVCAALAGYVWYRMMRWSFRHMIQPVESEQGGRSEHP
jgi:hypothetical protein